MCSDAAHSCALTQAPDPRDTFLYDAQENLTVVREVFGTQSRRYLGLVERYLATAEALECRSALVRVLISLVPPMEQ